MFRTLQISMFSLLILSCCNVNISFGQNLYFSENPVWKVSKECDGSGLCGREVTEFNYYIDGDTVFNSHRYYKLYKLGSGYYNFTGPLPIPPQCIDTFTIGDSSVAFAFMRDTIGKVYFASPFQSDTLLFDFNLEVGDTLPLSFVNNGFLPVVIDSIDTFRVASVYRKRFHLSSNADQPYIYEGIGSNAGLFYSIFVGLNCASTLLCYGVADSSYFPIVGESCAILVSTEEQERLSGVSVFPVPAIDFVNIEIDGIGGSIVHYVELYTAIGQLVFSEEYYTSHFTVPRNGLNSGLYFYRIISEAGGIYTGKVVFH